MKVFGKEREYIVHDETQIKGFFGDYRFLSNFHEAEVFFEGLKYRSTENAYQAAKCKYFEDRETFCQVSPSDSKKMGKTVEMRENWTEIKLNVMASVVFDKFNRHIDLREKLLATGDAYLEETNHWGDKFWGVCEGKGENHLGRVLMGVRDFWKRFEPAKRELPPISNELF